MAKMDIERMKQLIECGFDKNEALDIVKAEAEEETKIELEKAEKEKAEKEKAEKEKAEKEKAEEKNTNLTKEDVEQMMADREADRKTEKEEEYEDMGARWARLHK